jgi:hypothetical protein
MEIRLCVLARKKKPLRHSYTRAVIIIIKVSTLLDHYPNKQDGSL